MKNTVYSRALAIGGTALALVLAETFYMGQTASQAPPVAPLAAPVSHPADSKFTLTLPRPPAPVSHKPSKPIIGLISSAGQRPRG
ncbi:MAG TPA: hypothetical protein VME66_12015 [Candidatus Acidoferrales bacterium]|nr:hypothetical protein [Candidatus Acidoferrales bacterium]